MSSSWFSSSSGSAASPGNPQSPEDPTEDCDDCGCDDATSNPVRYFNGEVLLTATDVSGALSGFSHTRSYSNKLAAMYDGPNGNNWLMPGWPYLVQDGSDIVFVRGQSRVWFDSSLDAKYGADDRYSLSHDSGAKTYTLTMTGGGVQTYLFHDFTVTTTPKGFLKESTDVYGEVTSAHSYNGESIEELRRTEGGTLWSILYTFYGVGSYTDRIETATLRKSTNSGSTWTDIRRATYDYYAGSTAYGSQNDLETVTVQWIDGSTWKDASKTYYRWYKSGDTNGFEGGLRYVVGPAAYAEMLADSLTPETATNVQVEGYADHFFEYDSTTREVTKEVATNCAGCGGGSGTGGDGETFVRTSSAHADGYNNWKWKVVLTKGNGNVETVYTNYLGQVMLKELKESASSSRKWITYKKYGTTGGAISKAIEQASPAAVTSYDDTNADLDVSLKSASGLITYTSYGDSTTASGETLGDALGYVKQIEISEGTSGTKIKQRVTQYKTSSADSSGNKSIVAGKQTVYTDDAGTDAIETAYAYLWYTSPVTAMKERTTTLPTVSTGQHGTGNTVTTKQYYDDRGRMTFSQDPRNIITKNTYDTATGLMTKTQVDVDAGPSGAGWTVGGSTPHLDVTTDYEYDDLGRQTQVLGQEHEANPTGSTASDIRHASWTVYIEGVSSDQTWSGQGYRETSGGTDTLIDPVSISFTDKNGRGIDQVQSKRSTGSGKLSSSDTFLRADWSRWSTFVYSTSGLLEYERTYHTIPSQSPDEGLGGITSDPGADNTNYEETYYGYDADTNLRVRVLTPGGTISRTVYDAINRMSSSWIGTDDGVDWKLWDPASPGTNMKKLTENTYDGGSSGGNSNLTLSEQFADDNTTRETAYAYDFRNRQTSVTDPIGRVSVPTYDNLGRVTESKQYDGAPGSGGTLIGKQASLFDDMGRTYEAKQYEVDPDTGTVGNALTGQSWHDDGGNVIESIAPGNGEVFTKTEYDNLSRQTRSYVGYDDSGDIIVVDQETTYNKISQFLDSTSKQRDTDTSVGTPTFRTSYTAGWYDGIGRSIASAAYGTNGGSAFTRPSAVPSRSDDVLVSTTSFNDAGEAYSSTDPKAIESRTTFDDMGRATSQIDNYKASPSGPDESRTTEFTYNADSQQETITAKMTAPADDEVTTYVYGVTTSGGSGLNANNVLAAIQYPTDTVSQRIDLKVNRVGQVIEREDQNGTIHEYAYDLLGRQTSDTVPTFGGGVDDAIKRFTTTYTTRGQVNTLTSHNTTTGSGGEVNQVQLEYNDFGQLISDWQEHDGAVVTSGGSPSKRVQYGYASGGSGSNQIRPESMIYPDGRQIDYNYGSTGSGTDLFNRVHAIKDGSTNLVQYKYLGGGQAVVADYTEPDIKLDLWGETVGTYDGLDRFGRVIDQRWVDYAGTPTDVARFQYGYDRDSLPDYRRDTVAHALSKGYDDLYGRDGLNRLDDYQRGQLNSGNTAMDTLKFQQDWTLDQVANWNNFNQDDDGSGTDDLVQTRTNNKSNEITGITNTTGSAWVSPAYDNAGNTTTLPKPELPTAGFTAKYDAWNRMVELSDQTSATKVAEYTYDARGFRIRKENHDSSGTLELTTDCYYTGGWRCIEEIKTPASGTGSTGTYVWGLRYVDDLVCRDVDTQRLYALSDRSYSVIAIVDTSGDVQERYAYSPYGEAVFMDADYNNNEVAGWSDLSADDWSALAVGADDLSWSTLQVETGAVSSYGWQHLFQGLSRDEESGLYENRNRMLDPLTGRFLQRDPLGYPDGMNAYAAYHVMHGGVDPMGLQQEERDCKRRCSIQRELHLNVERRINSQHLSEINNQINRLMQEDIGAGQNLSDAQFERLLQIRNFKIQQLRGEINTANQIYKEKENFIEHMYKWCVEKCEEDNLHLYNSDYHHFDDCRYSMQLQLDKLNDTAQRMRENLIARHVALNGFLDPAGALEIENRIFAETGQRREQIMAEFYDCSCVDPDPGPYESPYPWIRPLPEMPNEDFYPDLDGYYNTPWDTPPWNVPN